MAQDNEWNGWLSHGLRLGRNLRELRRMRGLTQDQLATLTGLARNTISNIERNLGNAGTAGDPQMSTVYLLARALDVPPAALLPGGDQKVADICRADYVGIRLAWPREQDLEPFRRSFVEHGSGPRYESEIAREVLPDDEDDDLQPIEGPGAPTE